MNKVKKHIKYAKTGDILILRVYSHNAPITEEKLCTVLKVIETEYSWVLKYTRIGALFKNGNEVVSWKHYDKLSLDEGNGYEYFLTDI